VSFFFLLIYYKKISLFSLNRSYSNTSNNSNDRRKSYHDSSRRRSTRSRSNSRRQYSSRDSYRRESVGHSHVKKEQIVKKTKTEDDEDLEAFYNKLKQKAADKTNRK
jgi:hypothetical protein